jgi:hypothetical protein
MDAFGADTMRAWEMGDRSRTLLDACYPSASAVAPIPEVLEQARRRGLTARDWPAQGPAVRLPWCTSAASMRRMSRDA